MNNIAKISTFEAISLVVIVMLNNIILNVPKEILKDTSSSAWLNVLLLFILSIILIIAICKLLKNFPCMDILDISEYLAGKPLKFIVGLAFIVMFTVVSASFLRMFSDLLQIIFLNHTPPVFIISFFLLGIIIANKLGISAIAKASSIAVILGVISFAILIISLCNYYNIYNIFPILGYGATETFFNGLTNIYAFAGLSILYFIKPILSSEKKFSKVAIISVITSGVLLLFSILNQILMFGVVFDFEILAGMVFSTRILNFGDFFQRVDAIFTFLWIFSQISYISIASFLILYILKKITNTTVQNGMLYSVVMVIFGICVLPKTFLELSTTIIPFSNIYRCILVFIIVPIILILANLKFKGKYIKKSGGNNG